MLSVLAVVGFILLDFQVAVGAILTVVAVVGATVLLAFAPRLTRAVVAAVIAVLAALSVAAVAPMPGSPAGSGSSQSGWGETTETRERVDTPTQLWAQAMDVADDYGDSAELSTAYSSIDPSYLSVNLTLMSGHRLNGRVGAEETVWTITDGESRDGPLFDGRLTTADLTDTARTLSEENPWGLSFTTVHMDRPDGLAVADGTPFAENEPILRFTPSDQDRPVWAETRADGTPAGTWMDTDDPDSVLGAVDDALTLAGRNPAAYELQFLDVSPVTRHVRTLDPEGWSGVDGQGGLHTRGMVDGITVDLTVKLGGFPRLDVWGATEIEPVASISDINLSAVRGAIDQAAGGEVDETTWRIDVEAGETSAKTGVSGQTVRRQF